jgi:hypothetical protein
MAFLVQPMSVEFTDQVTHLSNILDTLAVEENKKYTCMHNFS